MNYISRHMEEKYGIPWVEYNFFGPTKIEESLRRIASHFDDPIKEGAERVIAKYKALTQAVVDKYKPRLAGKKVMLFVGGLRPRHVIGAYEDLGMEVVGTGYEFGHNDDYQRTTHYVKDGTLIYDGLRVRKIRREGAARSGRLRHQGKVRIPKDGRAVPPDALLGLLGAVPRL
jgi:nitrogenase molybdenum-iron protein alpha chain